MCQYDIGLDANIDDLIMGEHIKVMLTEERDKYLVTLMLLNQVINIIHIFDFFKAFKKKSSNL